MTLRVLDPTFADLDATEEVASRLASLSGRTIALLDNSKLNVEKLLDRIEALLRSQHGVGQVVRLTKPDASRPAPDDVIAGLKECDALISAVGD